MDKLAEFLRQRRELAARYDAMLRGLPLILPWQHPDGLSAWHLYVVRPDAAKTQVTRAQMYEGLRARGIAPQVHYIPVHTQPWYQGLGFQPGDFPEAEAYYSGALSLPMFASLSHQDQDQVVAALREILCT